MVLRDHSLHGRAILFSALPRFGTLPRRCTDRGVGVRPGRIYGLDRLAANAEWRSLGAPGFLVSPTRRPGSSFLGQRVLVRSVLGDGLARRTPPDSDIPVVSRRRHVALL